MCPVSLNNSLDAFIKIKGAHPALTSHRVSGWSLEEIALRGIASGWSATTVMKSNGVTWKLRILLTRGLSFASVEDIVRHGRVLFWNERLRKACMQKRQAQQRRERLREPTARPGNALYRTDGAARGRGRQGDNNGDPATSRTGWGAVLYDASGLSSQASLKCWGYLGERIPNNVAEYMGLHSALGHAIRPGHRMVCVQVDSLLVRQQCCYLVMPFTTSANIV